MGRLGRLGAVALLLGAGAAWVGVAAGVPDIQPEVACAREISADLAAQKASGLWDEVPEPEFVWLVDGCAGRGTEGVFGDISVFEDGSYRIVGYGDSWRGCLPDHGCSRSAGPEAWDE